jgi:hypothetical protein
MTAPRLRRTRSGFSLSPRTVRTLGRFADPRAGARLGALGEQKESPPALKVAGLMMSLNCLEPIDDLVFVLLPKCSIEEAEEVHICNQTAAESFSMLDQKEYEPPSRQLV